MEQKFEDDRFKLEDAKKKYHQIYERIKSEPDSFDQTPLWYEIYNKHRNNTIVLQGFDGVSADQVWELNKDVVIPDVSIILLADDNLLAERLQQRDALSV